MPAVENGGDAVSSSAKPAADGNTGAAGIGAAARTHVKRKESAAPTPTIHWAEVAGASAESSTSALTLAADPKPAARQVEDT